MTRLVLRALVLRSPGLRLLRGAAALLLLALAACGVGSDTVCHDTLNPCGSGLVCSAGACVTDCNLDASICPVYYGCEQSSGRCYPYCDFRSWATGCPQGLVCHVSFCHAD